MPEEKWIVEETTLSICRGIVSVEEVRALAVRAEKGTSAAVIAYLPFDEDREKQAARAMVIKSAPDLLAACKLALEAFETNNAIDWSILAAAIYRAEHVVGVTP